MKESKLKKQVENSINKKQYVHLCLIIYVYIFSVLAKKESLLIISRCMALAALVDGDDDDDDDG